MNPNQIERMGGSGKSPESRPSQNDVLYVVGKDVGLVSRARGAPRAAALGLQRAERVP